MEYFENLQLNDLDNEVWKSYCSGGRDYLVSNLGRVKHFDKRYNKLLVRTQGSKKNVYKSMYFGDRREYVHRVVATLFIREPKDGEVINHKNGKKHDNSVENLEWVTQYENIQHSINTGLSKRSNEKFRIKKATESRFRSRKKKYNIIIKKDGKLYSFTHPTDIKNFLNISKKTAYYNFATNTKPRFIKKLGVELIESKEVVG